MGKATLVAVGIIIMGTLFSSIKTFFNLSDKFEHLKTGHSNLERDHHEIKQAVQSSRNDIKDAVQSSRENTVKDLSQINTTVSWIKTDLDRTRHRIDSMTTSERDVKDALDTMQNHLIRTHENRKEDYSRIQTLKKQIEEFKANEKYLREKLSQKEQEIKDLKSQVRALTPEPPQPDNGYDGPRL